ncbi:hypothetical protein J8Z24_16445 [Pseudoalteromonas sp. SCSIO 43201]|uniref:hypothetical protein n=1 Tax=Pseudoalteromonas sp. SCSIO 43201 TaxID=2822842 RepID=UPI002075C837|nr:hypothetical protein [Pseudoalteromonas sp. SCSIO 43201]USD28474.1 hypothetical protein J8Z24_16445 [Pseudoalteromonas sp. SCSIO 43201]
MSEHNNNNNVPSEHNSDTTTSALLTPQPHKNRQTHGRFKLSRSKMNTILALCAMFISAASFYATYLQAKAAQEQVSAAEKQLKTETWPWLQFSYSNFDLDSTQATIRVDIRNSGTGPAVIHHIKYELDGETYYDVTELMDACCNLHAYQAALSDAQDEESNINYLKKFGWYVSSEPQKILLADGDSFNIFTMPKSNFNRGLWDKIDDHKSVFKAQACYCSILKECYITNEKAVITEVPSCSTIPTSSINK